MASTARSVGEILRTALDGSTWALETINYEHHEIHSGSSFVASGTADVANGGTVNALIKTPNSATYAHITVEAITESEVAFNLYEGFVVGAAGTVGTGVTAYNRNRTSSGTPTVLVYTGASAGTSGGTIGTAIFRTHWGSGRGIGGQERAVSEWVLKSNTQYLLEIVNATSNANYTAWSVNWYEHADKE